MRVADEVWISTALLHRAHPDRKSFSLREIREMAAQEKLVNVHAPGFQHHVSYHCVASKQSNPGKLRMLTEEGRGLRRLFRFGDKEHPSRKGAKMKPNPDEIDPKYLYLLEWYDTAYCSQDLNEVNSGPVKRMVMLGRIMARVTNMSNSELAELERKLGPR